MTRWGDEGSAPAEKWHLWGQHLMMSRRVRLGFAIRPTSRRSKSKQGLKAGLAAMCLVLGPVALSGLLSISAVVQASRYCILGWVWCGWRLGGTMMTECIGLVSWRVLTRARLHLRRYLETGG
ncbi:hypothetical protein GGI42DRAFT_102908 [Trichoderma sp. SZMC 28013]